MAKVKFAIEVDVPDELITEDPEDMSGRTLEDVARETMHSAPQFDGFSSEAINMLERDDII